MSASISSQPAQAAFPPPSTSVLFARGVLACLAIWPALRVAVDQRWGGPDSASKSTWLAGVIVDAFEEQDSAPDVPYIELTLLQVMEDEFDCVLEDGSAEDVAREIVALWKSAQEGNVEAVTAIEAKADTLKGKKVQMEEAPGDQSDWEDDSDEEMDSEEEEAPALVDTAKPSHDEPEIDEDGFTLVKGKNKRG
ncbi:hypothetical protein EUX98_g2022 [Antrodiella citrinella]|uniref:Pre-rRNA-processing protein TSR2 n=1 Tax=Antrodiella citrinella TaxID=2447956 RepID=A0A4S4N004_9APHY|nr:hypothetical protein EUX98_g2022 [Antrodiella citrinella]